MRTLILPVLTLLATACTGIPPPPGGQALPARPLPGHLEMRWPALDHGFERGLNRVTATYKPKG